MSRSWLANLHPKLSQLAGGGGGGSEAELVGEKANSRTHKTCLRTSNGLGAQPHVIVVRSRWVHAPLGVLRKWRDWRSVTSLGIVMEVRAALEG